MAYKKMRLPPPMPVELPAPEMPPMAIFVGEPIGLEFKVWFYPDALRRAKLRWPGLGSEHLMQGGEK